MNNPSSEFISAPKLIQCEGEDGQATAEIIQLS